MCIEWDAKRTKLDLEPVDGGQCLADRIMNSRLFVSSLLTPSEITLEDQKLLIVILQDKDDITSRWSILSVSHAPILAPNPTSPFP